MVVGDASKGSDLAQIRKYKVALTKGIALFNKHPIKGVEYLIHAEILKNDPEDIASFFEKTDGLDKSRIGEYLGNTKEMCLEVMHAYVDGLDFSGMELDVALRSHDSGFLLISAREQYLTIGCHHAGCSYLGFGYLEKLRKLTGLWRSMQKGI